MTSLQHVIFKTIYVHATSFNCQLCNVYKCAIVNVQLLIFFLSVGILQVVSENLIVKALVSTPKDKKCGKPFYSDDFKTLTTNYLPRFKKRTHNNTVCTLHNIFVF